MVSISSFLFALLCVTIKTQTLPDTGFATASFPDLEVNITVQVYSTGVEIAMCGPSLAWYGVGFGSDKMDGTYAIMVYSTFEAATLTKFIKEFTLAPSGSTTPQGTAFDRNIEVTKLDTVNGFRCVTTKRPIVDTAYTSYTFPNSFSALVETKIIVAKGTDLNFWDSQAAMANKTTATLTYSQGIAPTAEPTARPTDGQVKSSSSTTSAHCFSSDSYVLTYPDFERKQIEDLDIYDKILTYDELKDEFFWDELLVKLHFEEWEFLNTVQVIMREFVLNNGEILSMTDNHLLYVGDSGLQRADTVKLGDKLKQFDGSFVDVVEIRENVMKYPRNMITYNGNLVINGIAVSTFTETIWGESVYWGKSLRSVMKYGYSYNIWRYPAYYAAKLWTKYASIDFKQYVLKFYFNQVAPTKDDDNALYWFSFFSSS